MLKKILLIDDDEEICEEISEALQDEGYDVHVSNDGLEGYALIKEGDYDLILLDVRLPGMNGLDILKRVRQSEKKVNIIVITGMPMAHRDVQEQDDKLDYALETLKLADGILSKPFNMTAMIAAIKNVTKFPSV